MDQNNQSKPSPQSTQQSAQPVSQPPYGDSGALKNGKKKKVGLIIGIISGVLALILIIVAVLLYFLWWQNPQKMVTDAVMNSITSKKAVTSGKATINMGEAGKVELAITGASNDSKSKTDIDITFSTKQISSSMKIKGNVVVDDKGTLYIKASGLTKAAEVFIDNYVKAQMSSVGEYGSSSAQVKAQIQAMKDEFMKQVRGTLLKVEDKWMKVSAEEYGEGAAQCGAEMIKKLSQDDTRKEIASAYEKNAFLNVKTNTVEDRNGARGFEIELDKDKAKDFVSSLRDTSFGKEFSNCSNYSYVNSGNTAADVNGSVKLWVDGSHKLKAVGFNLSSNKRSEYKIEGVFDIDSDKSETINVPSDTTDLKDVIKDFNRYTSSLDD